MIEKNSVAVIRILVVADQLAFRKRLISILKGAPDLDIVGQAPNGTEAIAVAKEIQPDVVVLDLSTCGENNIKTTNDLLQIMPRGKIIILTGSNEFNDFLNAMKAGARGYILRSAELEGIITSIRAVASGNIIITSALTQRLIKEMRQETHDVEKVLNELSPRQNQVTQLIARGFNNKEIAALLSVSETTVKAHVRAILERLQVKNRAQLAAKTTTNEMKGRFGK